ncbi:MAG: ABC transporter ATP-binding protein [Butyricicoccaceae bacterium]
MKTLAKYLKPQLPAVVLGILLIVAQAWCDLKLPDYTSTIVDTGIAASGIEERCPVMLPAAEYDRLAGISPEAAAAYQIFDESCPDYEELARRFPEHGNAYWLAGEATQALEEAFEPLAAQAGGSERYGSAMTAYIARCYEQLGVDIQNNQMGYIIGRGLRMLGIVLLSVGASILISYISANVGARLSRDMRRDVYARVLSFSPSEFDKFSTASLITRSTNDIQQVQMIVIMGMRMVAYAPIMAVGGVIKVVRTNVSMTWIIALAVAIIAVVLALLLKIAMPRFNLRQKLVDRLNLVSREVLTGLPVIRAFGTEQREIDRFGKANTDLMQTALFVNRAMGMMTPVMNLVMNGTTLMIVWFGAAQILRGSIQVGTMMAFITYATQIISAFLMLGMMSISLPRAMVSVRRINEVLHTESAVRDPAQPEMPDPAKSGTVEFDHVDFAYPGAEEKVLHDITFTALPGQTTALIGATGCGKSTIVNLIPRFFDVTGGSIRVSGVDVRRMEQKTLRAMIGLVPQKSVLFSGTIGTNIAFSDEEMDQGRVEAAADIAQAREFIDTRPEGYDAVISQGGANVSGGQKQRLCIARALAKQAPIYIFDDSFSALDYKTDRKLRQALAEQTGQSAVLIVAQRISTVMNADKIIVLEDGRIVGMGTHKSLMESCETYREIALSQLSKEELANG